MDLGTRLAKPGTTLADLEAWFDDMDHAGRMDAIKTSSRAHQRMLWHKAAGATPLTLDDMVPSSVPDVTEVIHHGRNSLPLPSAFKFFQKRMARPSEGDDVLFGYNEGKTRPWIGPGYFVLRQTEGNAQWMPRGALVVDYFSVPDSGVPSHWPRVVPNSKGLQMFVYDGTRDFLRRVSSHVVIGAAYKGETAIGQYFVLVREDR